MTTMVLKAKKDQNQNWKDQVSIFEFHNFWLNNYKKNSPFLKDVLADFPTHLIVAIKLALSSSMSYSMFCNWISTCFHNISLCIPQHRLYNLFQNFNIPSQRLFILKLLLFSNNPNLILKENILCNNFFGCKIKNLKAI